MASLGDMQMPKVKVIIGANYGDEGKGLATNYFSNEAKASNQSCLNVLFNGSCQRGHTVELKDGTRHVFHHFGSGTFAGAATYFDEDFIVNPIFFVEEYTELRDKYGVEPVCYLNPRCRVGVPYDAFINQLLEASRGDQKHGSCGLGVWETVCRYDSIYSLTFEDMVLLSDELLDEYLNDIASQYVESVLFENGVYSRLHGILELCQNEQLRTEYIKALRAMQHLVEPAEFEDLVKQYDVIVFEGGQGLALDQDSVEMWPHVTASATGSRVPVVMCKDAGIDDVEVVYVTRTYFTRHGAGPFPTECPREELGLQYEDETNVYNPHQGSIRYGRFDEGEFRWRVKKDMEDDGSNYSLFVTHSLAVDTDGICLCDLFRRFYYAADRYADGVFKINIAGDSCEVK